MVEFESLYQRFLQALKGGHVLWCPVEFGFRTGFRLFFWHFELFLKWRCIFGIHFDVCRIVVAQSEEASEGGDGWWRLKPLYRQELAWRRSDDTSTHHMPAELHSLREESAFPRI